VGKARLDTTFHTDHDRSVEGQQFTFLAEKVNRLYLQLLSYFFREKKK